METREEVDYMPLGQEEQGLGLLFPLWGKNEDPLHPILWKALRPVISFCPFFNTAM